MKAMLLTRRSAYLEAKLREMGVPFDPPVLPAANASSEQERAAAQRYEDQLEITYTAAQADRVDRIERRLAALERPASPAGNAEARSDPPTTTRTPRVDQFAGFLHDVSQLARPTTDDEGYVYATKFDALLKRYGMALVSTRPT